MALPAAAQGREPRGQASWRKRRGRGASRALGPARRAPRPQPEGSASLSRARVLGSGPRRRRWREGFVAVGGTGSGGTVSFRAATVGRPLSALPGNADQRGASGDVRCGAVRCAWHAWLCCSGPRAARLAAPRSVPGAEHQRAALQVSGRQGDEDPGARPPRLAWKRLGLGSGWPLIG